MINSSTNLWIQIASQLAIEVAIYSTFAKLSENIACFFQ